MKRYRKRVAKRLAKKDRKSIQDWQQFTSRLGSTVLDKAAL
jgi:hypothetical protein